MKTPYDKELTAKEIAALRDDQIDASDIPELDDAFWAKAKLHAPRTKQAVTIRYDSDILEWFKAQGKGYQTRMNSVLRAYVEAQRTDA